VRDLAKQQGKEVNLVLEGGDNSVDKRILEEMKDPLLHLLRNAIDHGIETPQERQSLGKPDHQPRFVFAVIRLAAPLALKSSTMGAVWMSKPLNGRRSVVVCAIAPRTGPNVYG
jgi:hypothetical protein